MKINLSHRSRNYEINLKAGIDLSLGIGTPGPRAWYVLNPVIEPVVMDNFVGSVTQGSSTNFYNISFNPHGHGTHTECLGHVTPEKQSLDDCLKEYFFMATVISITPRTATDADEEGTVPGDLVIDAELLERACLGEVEDALIIRTLPNAEEKKSMDYSNTNPPYLTLSAAHWLVENGVQHLLLDLPSVDRENDEGKLSVHKIFWGLPEAAISSKTITEMIFVPDGVKDGMYFLNLQVPSFRNDAAPSRPVLFEMNSL
ncbi:MAG: cyclase family protein [Bacteroidota bacterium]